MVSASYGTHSSISLSSDSLLAYGVFRFDLSSGNFEIIFSAAVLAALFFLSCQSGGSSLTGPILSRQAGVLFFSISGYFYNTAIENV